MTSAIHLPGELSNPSKWPFRRERLVLGGSEPGFVCSKHKSLLSTDNGRISPSGQRHTMSSKALLNTVIVLSLAILGVIGYKVSPLILPAADTRLPPVLCSPSESLCTTNLPGGARVSFALMPHPIRPLQTLDVSVRTEALKPDMIEVDFDGVDMKMGYNRIRLNGMNGVFSGQLMLPVCVSGSMRWAATVIITTPARQFAIPFHFDVAGR